MNVYRAKVRTRIASRSASLALYKLSTTPFTRLTHTARQPSAMVKPINLQLGWPSRSLLPALPVRDASVSALTDKTIAGDALTYGADAGYLPLRESIAKWLTNFYNPAAGPIDTKNIFIGNGASATFGIMLQKFTDPLYTKRAFMIEPTYFLACPIMEDAGFEGKLRGVPEDEEGLDVGFLRSALEQAEREESGELGGRQRLKSEAKYPKLYRYIMYAVPTFSNPSAKVMSLRRRQELVKLAREYDVLIITDDVYDMLRWPVDSGTSVDKLPPSPPRMVELDRELPGQSEFGNTASNGTFSKLAGPGTRTSWVQGTEKFVFTLSTHGATKSGGAPSQLSAVFMDQMLRSGSLMGHINEVMIPTYRKRYAVLMDSIEELLVPLGAKVATGQAYEHDRGPGQESISEAGGFFTYVALPDDLQPAEKVAKIALDNYALKFAHGAMMVAAGDKGCLERAKTTFGKGVRLCWAWHDEADIREGVERLATVMKDIRNGTVKKPEQGDGDLLDQR